MDEILLPKVTLSFLTLNKITEKHTHINRNEYNTKNAEPTVSQTTYIF